MSDDDRFCDRCDVVKELHPNPDEYDPQPWECDIAERKADLLARMGMLR